MQEFDDFDDFDSAFDTDDMAFFDEEVAKTTVSAQDYKQEAAYIAMDSTDYKSTFDNVSAEYAETGSSALADAARGDAQYNMAEQYKSASLNILNSEDLAEGDIYQLLEKTQASGAVHSSSNKIIAIEGAVMRGLQDSPLAQDADRAEATLAALPERITWGNKFEGVDAVFNRYISDIDSEVFPSAPEEAAASTRLFGNIVGTVTSAITAPYQALGLMDDHGDTVSKGIKSLPSLESMASTAVPLQYNVMAASVSSEILGKDSIQDGVLVGSFIEKLAHHINDSKDPEAASIQVLESIMKNSGLGAKAIGAFESATGATESQVDAAKRATSNKLIAIEMMQAVKSYGTKTEEEREVFGVDWEKSLYNVLGVVDVIPLAGLGIKSIAKTVGVIKKAQGAGRTRPTQPQAIYRDAHESEAASVEVDEIKEALTAIASGADPEDVIKHTTRTGSTVDQLIKDTLPVAELPRQINADTSEFILKGAPTRVVEEVESILEGAKSFVKDLPQNTYALRDSAFVAKEAKLTKVLTAAKLEVHAQSGSSVMRSTNGGNSIEIDMIYTNTADGAGWDSAEEALESASQLMKDLDGVLSESDTVIMQYNPKVGEYTTELVDGQGEYFIRLRDTNLMSATDTMADFDGIVGASAVGRYSMGPSELFDIETYGGAVKANETEAFVSKGMHNIAKAYHNLGSGITSSKRKVNDILADGDADGVVYSYTDLAKKGLNEKEIQGYFGARAFWDTTHHMQNAKARADLVAKGVRRIVVTDPESGEVVFENAAKILKLEDAQRITAKEVYNPVTHQTHRVTPEMLDTLYREGKSIVKPMSAIGDDVADFDYIVLGAKHEGAEITALPSQVMSYRKGHVSRVNTEPYYVKQHHQVVKNGDLDNPYTKQNVKLVAGSKAEATAALAKLKQDMPELHFEVHMDRNIESTISDFDEANQLVDPNLSMWFAKRGDRLTNAGKVKGRVISPTEMMSKAAKSIGKVHGHDLFIKGLENDLAIMEGMIKNNNLAGDDLKKLQKKFDTLQSQVDMWKGSRSTFDVWFTTFSNDMAALASSSQRLSPATNAAIFDVTKGFVDGANPMRFASSTAAKYLLFTNPLRQIVVQGMGSAHMVGINPKAMLSSYAEAPLLLTSIQARKNKSSSYWKAQVKAAEALGYKGNEWAEVVESFHKSGKVQAVDSNLWIQGIAEGFTAKMPDSAKGRALNVAKVGLGAPVQIMKKVGFDAGEATNQAIAWNFARKDAISNGKGWKSAKEADEISVKSRSYGFDMTNSGAMKYSRGNLAVTTQFLSVTHKAALNTLPASAEAVGMRGNQLLDGRRKQYIAGLVGAFGASGLGLGKIAEGLMNEAGIEPESELGKSARDVVLNGFSEEIFNLSLGAISGEDDIFATNVAWTKSFAPASGTVEFLHDLTGDMLGAASFREVMAGPSDSAFKSIYKSAQNINNYFGYTDKKITDPMFHLDAIGEGLKEVGVFKNIHQAIVALDHYEKSGELLAHANDKGTVEIQRAELWTKALVGFGVRSTDELYAKVRDAKISKDDEKKFVDKLAQGFLAINSKYGLHSQEGMQAKKRLTAHMTTNYAHSIGLMSKVENATKGYGDAMDLFLDEIKRDSILLKDDTALKAEIHNNTNLTDDEKAQLLRLNDAKREAINAVNQSFGPKANK